MICYCISGLGADHRIFSRVDLPGVSLRHLPWLMPQPDEPIAGYAGRMRAGIEGDNPILIGVSFGGMMAIEIAKFYPSATVILVSSLRDLGQRQGWMTIGKILHFERWLSRRNPPRQTLLRRMVARFEEFYLGVETAEEAALFRAFRDQTDRGYLRWAVGSILRWENQWCPPNLYQLHGGRDRIFRLSSRAVTHFVPTGGHMMIHNRPEIVSKILAGILENHA